MRKAAPNKVLFSGRTVSRMPECGAREHCTDLGQTRLDRLDIIRRTLLPGPNMPSRNPLDALSLVLGSVEAVRNLRALYVLLTTFASAGSLATVTK